MGWTNKFNTNLASGITSPTGVPGASLDVYDKREQRAIWPTPVVKALQQSEKIFVAPMNRYDMMDKFVENDSELESGIDIKASMVRRAYRGLKLRVGKDVTPEEEVLSEFLKSLEKWLNLKRKFKIIPKKLMRYGDWIYKKEMKGGMPILRSLPIKYMSVVDNVTQLEDIDAQIFSPNYYVLNEYREEKRHIYHKSRVLHFSIEKEGAEIYDQYGRYTYEVFSPSPLLPLTQLILWKHNIIITDIMIRHKMLPREVHAVNTLGINPQTVGDPGDNYDARVKKADAEIRRVLSQYELNIAYVGADRGYIHQAEGVAISILEPKSTKYLEPNEIIEQINASYAKRIGIPINEISLVKGDSYASSVIKTSFATIRTIDLAELIADRFLEYIREYIVKTYPAYANLCESIYIDIDLVMDQEEERRFRIAALMKTIGEFTPTEIREAAGYEKATKEQQQEIDEMIEKGQPAAEPGMQGRSPGQSSARSIQKRSSEKSQFPDTARQKSKEQVV